MISLYQYVAPPSPCGYLADKQWSLEYEYFLQIGPEEYMARMKLGWRRFGSMLFRPRCQTCQACRSLRVPVDRFQPNRSQKRTQKLNEGVVTLEIGVPDAARPKLKLYDRYHAFQADSKGWPSHPAKDVRSYRESFVDNPFPTEEWRYFLDGRLVGVGYVDRLSEGLSAIYYFYEPDDRDRSLGTWNVLSLLAEARRCGLPFLYLGYYVDDCRSLTYKGNFNPHQLLQPNGAWVDHVGSHS